MRIFRPGNAPLWLEHVLTSIERGLREIWPLPFRLWRVPTADLPPASEHEGAWLYDLTAGLPKFSDGSNWITYSVSSHTHAIGSITGMGTGVATALAVNVGSAGAFVTFNGALGTPSSGTLTNCAFPTLNQNTTGSAATLTTSRNIDGQAFNGSADINVIAPGTHAATSKATPVDADELPLVDSAASNVLKRLTWANLKATLKTYFDTLYPAVPSWTAPTLNTGWVSHSATDSTWQAVEYTKTADGHVYLRGLINPATATSKTMFTLPTGYRPAKRASFLQGNSAAGAAGYWVYVQDDGQVQLDTPALSSSQYIPLDVVQFWTA